MMMKKDVDLTKQQKEALSYFRKYATYWDERTKQKGKDRVNMIKQRNNYVLKVIAERKNVESALDVGCGTGDLVCQISKMGIKAFGIDFAKEMIEIAKKNAKKLRCKNTHFECCSVFDFDFNSNKFDVISANGFIEYISFREFNEFLNLAYVGLKKGGSLVLGSRNRLFNIFSLNEFTEDELKNEYLDLLVTEAIRLTTVKKLDELIKLKTVPYPHKSIKQINTGVKVSVRYQYTPVQLIKILRNKGFKTVQIYPIHIHGVSPRFKSKHPSLHVALSNLLQSYTDDNVLLIPYASSFMIYGKK